MKQELNLLDGYAPTNDLLNDAKQDKQCIN